MAVIESDFTISFRTRVSLRSAFLCSWLVFVMAAVVDIAFMRCGKSHHITPATDFCFHWYWPNVHPGHCTAHIYTLFFGFLLNRFAAVSDIIILVLPFFSCCSRVCNIFRFIRSFSFLLSDIAGEMLFIIVHCVYSVLICVYERKREEEVRSFWVLCVFRLTVDIIYWVINLL